MKLGPTEVANASASPAGRKPRLALARLQLPPDRHELLAPEGQDQDDEQGPDQPDEPPSVQHPDVREVHQDHERRDDDPQYLAARQPVQDRVAHVELDPADDQADDSEALQVVPRQVADDDDVGSPERDAQRGDRPDEVEAATDDEHDSD